MKTMRRRLFEVMALVLCLSVRSFGQSGPPSIPFDALLQVFSYPTNFHGLYGYLPMAYTNVESVPFWTGNALLVGNTNTAPSFLQYPVIETNGYTNFDFATGSIIFMFAPNWSSDDATQLGAGPGERAYLFGAGDWNTGSPHGFCGVSADTYGTNLSLWGMSNGVTTTYVNTRVSWATNVFHSVAVEWSGATSLLYLDGELVASGSGVSIVPATNCWTNGFFIGSDAAGYEQARGAFSRLEIWCAEYGDIYGTSGWGSISNGIVAWQGGGGYSGMAMGGGLLTSGGSSGTCVTGANVYITNLTATAVSGAGMTFTFSIEGGTNGDWYEVFMTTNLAGGSITDSVWTWLGSGTNCGTYAVTNQATNQTFYVLGTPELATDGSGLTVAYESLISSAFYTDPYHTPNAWYLEQGINPQTSGVAALDPDLDGIPNYQEYLYGTNPQVSEGFAVWVSEPGGVNGIP